MKIVKKTTSSLALFIVVFCAHPSDDHVEKVTDKLSEGDVVKVKVLEIDRQGRVRLSMKAVE